MPKTVPETPSAPVSLAPYSAAALAGDLVFLSGQVGIDPATGDRAPDDVVAQTHQVMTNVGALLGDLGLGYEDIVKTTIFLADIADFGEVNEVYEGYLKEPFPARSAIQAGALPAGFLIEIEVVASK